MRKGASHLPRLTWPGFKCQINLVGISTFNSCSIDHLHGNWYEANRTSETIHCFKIKFIFFDDAVGLYVLRSSEVGSRFGSCSCGVPATEGIPCRHIVVLAKSKVIHGLTRVNTMPLWWTTAQWRNQFPIEATMRSDISMNAIKTRHARDELLRYYPVWSAAAKKGRPKKHERRKTKMDHIEESAKKKRKRTNRMFCSLCEKFNTTQRTAIKTKWMEYRVTSTRSWALKLVIGGVH